MEVREPQGLSGKAIKIRSLDLRPVTADVGKPHVVAQDDHDVRRARRRDWPRGPPRFRIDDSVGYTPAESRVRVKLLRHVVGRPNRSRARHRLPPLTSSCRCASTSEPFGHGWGGLGAVEGCVRARRAQLTPTCPGCLTPLIDNGGILYQLS